MEKYRELFVKSETAPSIKNELLFEIASERVSGSELIRFIIYNNGDDLSFSKRINAINKNLRSFKSRGLIQFFANAESFEKNTTEAKYLINKYPALFENIPKTEDNSFFIYVKL